MFNILKYIIKIGYISISLMFLGRLMLTINGIKELKGPFTQIITMFYGSTNLLLAPINKFLAIITPYLPMDLRHYFPVFYLDKSGKSFLEWGVFIAICIYIPLMMLIEHVISNASDYEEAFLSLGRENSNTTKQKKKQKALSAQSTTTERIKSNTGAKELDAVYNTIIQRLGKEKKELVNKNIQLEKELITDALTGLKNRKCFNESLKYEFNNAKTRGYDLSLIMLDIDNFKQINDTLGHQAGDFILKETAQIVMDCSPRHALTARYGGEEIAIICCKLKYDQAHNIAEKIRSRVEEELNDNKNTPIKVTISAGISTFKHKNSQTTEAELLNQADQALYAAKNNGKNQIIKYESIL